MRDKKGVHNSYCSPDDVNAIDWSLKAKNKDLFDYYASLIHFRKFSPALHIGNADEIRKHLEFFETEDGVVAYRIKDHAAGDFHDEIIVILNANREPVTITLPTEEYYETFLEDGVFDFQAHLPKKGTATVAPQSAMILVRS